MPNAIFGFETPNIGDDVQALAAAALLPSVEAIVDRDRLDKVKLDEPHRLIMNSWFAIKNYRAVPSSSIDPCYFGYCVGRKELLNNSWLAEWRRRQPLGLRDRQSVGQLREAGLDCYFSGCLTTWMGCFVAPPARREGVLLVDVPEAMEAFIPSDLRARAERITNHVDPAIVRDQAARWASASAICDRLRTAELVVTRRLHVALPCVGFGTPVVVYLEGSPKNRGRFSGSDEFLPIVFHDGARPLDGPGWVEPREVVPPAELRDRFEALASSFGADIAARWRNVAEIARSLPEVKRKPKRSWLPFL